MTVVDPVPRGSTVRAGVWILHMALPLGVLWLLIAQPELDVAWQHNLSHFLMVGIAAAVAAAVGARMSADARLREDSRLLLVSLAFLAAASFQILHAVATPTVVVPAPNAGFVLATPTGLALASVLVLASCVDWDTRGVAVWRRAGWLGGALAALALGWAAVSVLRLPPLRDSLDPDAVAGPVVALAVVVCGAFAVGAVRYWQLHRRRRGAVLLSLLTAWTLLAESMVAVAIGPAWQLSWWLWHLTQFTAFVLVGYAAWVQLRLEGRSAGLFDGAGSARTHAERAAAQRTAVERFVDGVEAAAKEGRRVDATELSMAVMEALELTESQARVLREAGSALAEQRLLAARLGGLAAVGGAASVGTSEQAVADVARGRLATAFPGCAVTLRLDPDPPTAEEAGGGPASVEISAKGLTVGWLELRPRGDPPSQLDLEVARSFASQIGLAVENRRLYSELDGLFRSYMSPEVAAALVADPSQAHLGGAIEEVSVLFADLTGFTTFSERHPPEEVVKMLNAIYGAAVPEILVEGGTVLQFVGDEVMAVFNTPVRQPDHPRRAVRAGLALQRVTGDVLAEHPGWPTFRVGINTGPALVGNIGAEQMRNFTAIGDTTNTAARIQAAATPGTVLVGSATFEALGGDARSARASRLALKGKAEPVTVHEIEEVS